MDSWWLVFKDYLKEKKNITDWRTVRDDGSFPMQISNFLFSQSGAQYKPKFHFEEEVICNQPASMITVIKLMILSANDYVGCLFAKNTVITS